MWDKIINMAISNGIWAVLFLGLLIFQLRDSHRREEKYQETIASLNKSLGVVNSIKEDVEDVKKDIKDLNKKMKPKKPKLVKPHIKEVVGVKTPTEEIFDEATNY